MLCLDDTPDTALFYFAFLSDGVALGNWLILERWMNEDWFVKTSGNISAIDEWTFSESLGNATAAVLQEHWSTCASSFLFM